MAVPFLDLTRETAVFRDRHRRGGRARARLGLFVLGPEVEAFEEEFAAYCGARHAIGVASGTDAIAIALRAAGVGPGDEVITAGEHLRPDDRRDRAGRRGAGARRRRPERTRTLDPAVAGACDRANARAPSLPVHLYGQPADMDAIVARRARPRADRGRGRRAGAWRELGRAPRGHARRRGRLQLLPDQEPRRARRRRRGRHERRQRSPSVPRRLRNYGERRRYESVSPAGTAGSTRVQAAVLRAKLPSLDARNERRALLARRYHTLLEGFSRVALPEAAGESDARHLFVVCVDRRDELRARLDERGIGTLVHYPVPVHRHPAYVALADGPVPLR